LGTLVLIAASIDDVSCWCLLAIILATFKNSAFIALLAIGGGTVYVVGMLTVGRHILGIYANRTEQMQAITRQALFVVLLFLMLSSWFTLAIGIYQIFGAFIVGVALPRGRLNEELRKQFEPLTTYILLPIFFVFSGLNTQIGLVNTPRLWLLGGLIFLVVVC
jgi:Kef-type K+ transport system membrane component KefB